MADATTLALTEATFDDTLARTPGVLMVDFWAEWCGPCKALAPVLDEVVRESKGALVLAKVNVDECRGLATRFGIRSIPTVLLARGGKVIDQIVGNVPKGQLLKKLAGLA